MGRMTRRQLLVAAGGIMGAGALAGCSQVADAVRKAGDAIAGTHGDGPRIADAQAARNLCMQQVGKRLDRKLIHVGDEPEGANDLRELVIYHPLLAPEDEPGKVFGAKLTVSSKSRRAEGDALDDYAQYLFKDEMERPFRAVLQAMPGIAGWSARLIYVRFDTQRWTSDQLDAYRGAGTAADPHVEVVLMLPRQASAKAYAEIAEPCFRQLYALDQTVAVHVGIQGLDYRQCPLRVPDTDEIDVHGRAGAPDAARLERDFSSYMNQIDESKTWDGDGNPDGSPGDPGSTASYPVITWNGR